MNVAGARRAAIIVIHGIGQQSPVSTLGTVTQGLVDHGDMGVPVPVLVQLADQPRPVVRFPDTGVDLLEYAWQDRVHGRIGLLRTVSWLVRTLLAPLDFRRNWRVLSDSGVSPWAVVIRQVTIAVVVLLALLAPAAAAAWLLLTYLPGVSVTAAVPAVSPGGMLLMLLSSCLWLVALVGIGSALWDWLMAVRIDRRTRRIHGRSWRGIYGSRGRHWAWPAVLVSVLAVATAGGTAWAAGDEWSVLARWLQENRQAVTLLLGSLTAVALTLRLAWLLREYAGDIALYVASDGRPEHARTRDEIRQGAVDLIAAVLADTSYDRVVILGHSLGAVIAHDAINELTRRARAERSSGPPPLQRLKGLVTCGAPLDKVAYFFREQHGDHEAVRAQLQSFLHPLKRAPSGRDDGPYRFRPYRVPLQDLKWTNFHAPADPVSDGLVFHHVTKRIVCRYFPFAAHGAYWRDPRLYRELRELAVSPRASAPEVPR